MLASSTSLAFFGLTTEIMKMKRKWKNTERIYLNAVSSRRGKKQVTNSYDVKMTIHRLRHVYSIIFYIFYSLVSLPSTLH
ncbi:unnamed protein product [Caenorhabditis nigoni]